MNAFWDRLVVWIIWVVCEFGNASGGKMRSRHPKQLFFWISLLFWILDLEEHLHLVFSLRTNESERSWCLVQGEQVIWWITSCHENQRELHAENTEDGFKNLFKERYVKHVKTDRDCFMCAILLFKDCIEHAIYSWLEESVSPTCAKIGRVTKVEHIISSNKRINVERGH